MSKKVRDALLQFFKHRECCTMVRPVTLEDDLRRLDSLSLDKLRPQFLKELGSLRSMIIKLAEPK